MKKIFCLFTATIVLAAVGCSKDDAAQEEVKYVSEIIIGFEGDTRVTAAPNAAGLKFSFEDGEEICLNEYHPDRIGTNYYYVYDASSKTFKAKVEAYKLQEGKQYFAMAGNYMSISVKVVDGNIEAYPELDTNTGIKDMPMISDIFTASADGTIATMHHLVGVVEVPVKLSTDGSVVDVLYQLNLSGASGLSGEFTAIPVAPYFKAVTAPYSTTTSDVLNVTLSAESATSVFIPVLPGTYTNAITLNRFYYIGGELETAGAALGGSYSDPRTLVVERGEITKVTEHTLKLW